MTAHDWTGRVALVTGGTRGIGLATGRALGRLGAQVVLTHRWGSADESGIAAAFAEDGAPPPDIVEADAGNDEDTVALFDHIAEAHGRLDLLLANVCVAARADGALRRRDLTRSLVYSAWSVESYLDAMQDRLGRIPPYVVVSSSDGPDHFYPGYDYVAASKAALEGLVRELAARHPEARINAVRSRQVNTESFAAMFPERARRLIDRFEPFAVAPEEVADAVVALVSGRLDGVTGSTLVVDKGATFMDNLVSFGPILLDEGVTA